MHLRESRKRPASWAEYKRSIRHRWFTPSYGVELVFEWIAYRLGRWAFLEVLEYSGTFSVLIAVVFYCADTGNRRKQKHYQAWQVINTAQGKGGNGGRIDALQELNADKVSLRACQKSPKTRDWTFVVGCGMRRSGKATYVSH
jgi:hypothetical protein